MFTMVTVVGSLIFLFSLGYMADEAKEQVEDHEVHTADGHLHRRGRFGRFFLYLSLFAFSMLNLLIADNLFQVFVELGAGRRLLVLPDRVLQRAAGRQHRGEQGVHRQPHRRRRVPDRPRRRLDARSAR